MDSDFFRVERMGHVARCSMSNPANMNALGRELTFPMKQALEELLRDDDIRVIVLRGEGGNFCAGGDANVLGDNLDSVLLSETMALMGNVLCQLYQGPKPVITEVDGYAVGAGLGLALASDITYATERAMFSAFFIRLGGVPDFGVAYFLGERTGMARAREFILTGEVANAETALSMGIINKICPQETIGEQVMAVAEKMARRSPKALAWTKRALGSARWLDLKTTLDMEAHVQPLMLMGHEHKEAIRGFLGKQS